MGRRVSLPPLPKKRNGRRKGEKKKREGQQLGEENQPEADPPLYRCELNPASGGLSKQEMRSPFGMEGGDCMVDGRIQKENDLPDSQPSQQQQQKKLNPPPNRVTLPTRSDSTTKMKDPPS